MILQLETFHFRFQIVNEIKAWADFCIHEYKNLLGIKHEKFFDNHFDKDFYEREINTRRAYLNYIKSPHEVLNELITSYFKIGKNVLKHKVLDEELRKELEDELGNELRKNLGEFSGFIFN